MSDGKALVEFISARLNEDERVAAGTRGLTLAAIAKAFADHPDYRPEWSEHVATADANEGPGWDGPNDWQEVGARD